MSTAFELIAADVKIWIKHPEYQYDVGDIEGGTFTFTGSSSSESEIDFWRRFFDDKRWATDMLDARICVDITGMMRSHIMVLPMMFHTHGIRQVDFIYSDPVAYSSGIDTTFTRGAVEHVSQVPGYEGQHNTAPNTKDILIIGAGYDDRLIRAAAQARASADQYVLMALPSLQPHMYQESQVRLQKASESIHNYRNRSFLYAPASNPFMTAQVLSDHVKMVRGNDSDSNVYLSPVGVKTQVLGFAWFFLCECRDSATSIIFPYAPTYERETSRGIARLHIFRLELDFIV
ncbi:hypothetical protein ABZU78_10740 [Rhodococcus erythropolis]|uniref:hypothetical protein n=1 Tax=Rhodococcus erythropolis TaxID=1833 RepID=UPI0033A9B709